MRFRKRGRQNRVPISKTRERLSFGMLIEQSKVTVVAVTNDRAARRLQSEIGNYSLSYCWREVLPQGLVARCHRVVADARLLDPLSQLPTDDNLIVLEQMPGLAKIGRGARAARNLHVLFLTVEVFSLPLSWILNEWTLLGTAAALVIERIFAIRETRMLTFLSAVLLSLEVLATDFTGWEMARPDARRIAIRLLSGRPRHEWLLTYLQTNPQLLKQFYCTNQ